MFKLFCHFFDILFKDIINSNVELIDQLYEIINEEQD